MKSALLGLCLLAAAAHAGAQEIMGAPVRVANRGHVSFVPETVTVAAEKTSTVELRFRVDDGFHINSHKPSSELLIPTSLILNGEHVKVSSVDYPRGTPFRLAVGEGETLDVYQGEFRVRLTVVAPRGDSTLSGTLRYQACDTAACFPPRSLPVSVALTAK